MCFIIRIKTNCFESLALQVKGINNIGSSNFKIFYPVLRSRYHPCKLSNK